jgi:hypothetical protein
MISTLQIMDNYRSRKLSWIVKSGEWWLQFSLKSLVSYLLSKNIEIKMYKSIILPVLCVNLKLCL